MTIVRPRLSPELYQRLSVAAANTGASPRSLMEEILDRELSKIEQRRHKRRSREIARAKKKKQEVS